MWFDPHAKLAEIAGQPTATTATTATRPLVSPKMSQLSRLSQARPPQDPVLLVATPNPMTPQESNACADEILEALRGALTSKDLDRVIAQYAGDAQAIENMPDPLDAVRATHIRNFEALRRRQQKWRGGIE